MMTAVTVEAGLRVPADVYVTGFDHIQSAAFQNPALITVRQSLREMGKIAAETLVCRIATNDSVASTITIKPLPDIDLCPRRPHITRTRPDLTS